VGTALVPSQLNSVVFKAGDSKLTKTSLYEDIVTPNSEETTCFTKGYAKNFKGSGPLLLPCSPSPSKTEISAYDITSLQQLKIRFFTPREVANLLCFPNQFQFPPSVTTKQRYHLLGNSINVSVVAILLKQLMRDVAQESSNKY